MLEEIVLATRNQDKAKELKALLGDLRTKIRTLDEFPEMPEVEEDGDNCKDNAIKKALEVARHTGLTAVADDTGLAVDAMDGRPGIHAARYAGPGASYEDNWRKLLEELKGIPREKRTARFVTVAAIARPNGEVRTAEGVLEGAIAVEPVGSEGFGYDPVFVVSQLGITLAQLTPEEKNCISHRAQAFSKAKAILQRMSNGT